MDNVNDAKIDTKENKENLSNKKDKNKTVKVKMLKNVNICSKFLKDYGGIKRFEYNKEYDLNIDIAGEWYALGRCDYVHDKKIL